MDELQVFLIGIVAMAALLLVMDLSIRIPSSLQARRTFKAWKAIAEPLGLVAQRGDHHTVGIQGSVASRDFYVAQGKDSELLMRLRVEDRTAKLMILSRARERKLLEYGWRELEKRGEVRGGTGDAEFDANFVVRANDAGMARVERLGAKSRRALLDFPAVEVHMTQGTATLDFGYLELGTPVILAAQQVLSDLAGARAEDSARAI